MNIKTAKNLREKVVKDYNSIAKEFDQTRKKEWKEFDIFKPYIKDGQNLIDLGCGNGRFYKFIKEKAKINYLGIDNSEKILAETKRHFPKAKFIEADILEIPAKSSSMDIAIAVASFHHLPSLELRQKALNEISRILKENAILMISVWNLFQPKYKKYIWQSRLRHILSIGKYDSRDTFIPWAKSGVKRYYYAFKPKELKKLLSKSGFKILQEHHDKNFVFICQKIQQKISSKS